MKTFIRISLIIAFIIELAGCEYNYKVDAITSETKIIEQKNKFKKQSDENYKNKNSKNNLEKYVKLIGLSKDELVNSLDENPVSIGEGGLEFSKADIRVWLKNHENGPVEQIFTQNKKIDFNGVKIGDKIYSFKKIFGEPIEDDNSSAYSNFKYNNIILSVYYNPQTKITHSVYIKKF